MYNWCSENYISPPFPIIELQIFFISLSIFTSFILMLFHFKYIFIKHGAKERSNGSWFLWNIPLFLVIVTRIYTCFLSCYSSTGVGAIIPTWQMDNKAQRTNFSKTKQSLNKKTILKKIHSFWPYTLSSLVSNLIVNHKQYWHSVPRCRT